MSFLTAIIMSITSFFLAFANVPSYTEGVTGQPTSFFPSHAQSQNDRTISSLIYRGLFSYDIYGSLVPDLADTWSVSDDGLAYTIKLKGNQKWSDGSPINSNDLLYTSFKVADLAGVATDKVDDLTVRYTLPNKFAPFLSLMTVGIMPANSEEKQNPLMPLSSGDWRVVRVEKNGAIIKQVILRTISNKYDIKKIVFRYYSNESELVTAGKLGEIEGFLASDSHELQNFEDFKFPLQGIYYSLYFNLRDEKLKDLALRQKLEKTLDMKTLIYDRGIPVQGPLSRSVFTDEGLKFDKYDPKFEEDLSATALTITLPNINEHRDFIDRIQNMWKDKLKMNVATAEVDPKEMIDKVVNPRNFEILFYGQEVGRDPDRYVNWHSTQKDAPGLNLSGFEQVRADRALEEGRNELDPEKRIIHYNEFQKTVEDNTPAIFMYHPFMHYYVSKYIQGIGEKYTFTASDRFLDLYNWKRLSTN